MSTEIIRELRILLGDFDRAVARAEALAPSYDEGDLAWHEAYDAIFFTEASGRVSAILKELGLRLDYYDPDTTYEEDVRAYVSALEKLVATLPEAGPSEKVAGPDT